MRQETSVLIFGDVCADRRYCKPLQDAKTVFGDVLPFLRESDITVCNLEAPTSNCGKPIKKCGANLHCEPADIDLLADAGIDVFSLANNHILDFGEDALLETLQGISRKNKFSFGAGTNAEAARKPLFLERNGWKLGFLSFAEKEFNIAGEHTAGANLFDPYTSLNDIRSAKANCDYLVVLYHGGIEHYKLPSPLLQKKCRAMVDAGADIVLCQHSHCIGTLEEYHDSTILYGQGNSIFGRIEGDDDWNYGLLVRICLNEEQKKVSFRLLEATADGIQFAGKEEENRILERLSNDSANIADSAYIVREWSSFCNQKSDWYFPMLLCWGRVRNKLNRLLDNRLIRCFVKKSRLRVAMNLIRCDAHREVLQTALENTLKR